MMKLASILLIIQGLFASVIFTSNLFSLIQPNTYTFTKNDFVWNHQDSSSNYVAKRLKHKPVINAVWDKPSWSKADIITIARHMGPIPKYIPTVEAKMGYDQDNVYVIFRVKDRYVQSRILEFNGNVSNESCVEFFFAPDQSRPLSYFNLEINAGGTPLIFYITKPMSEVQPLKKEEIEQIEIAHSLPRVVFPELQDEVTWVIECRIPISLLEKYTSVTRPEKGSQWKGNFYKTGSNTSNPNYMTWALVEYPRPNFHLPQYFGNIQFK